MQSVFKKEVVTHTRSIVPVNVRLPRWLKAEGIFSKFVFVKGGGRQGDPL